MSPALSCRINARVFVWANMREERLYKELHGKSVATRELTMHVAAMRAAPNVVVPLLGACAQFGFFLNILNKSRLFIESIEKVIGLARSGSYL